MKPDDEHKYSHPGSGTRTARNIKEGQINILKVVNIECVCMYLLPSRILCTPVNNVRYIYIYIRLPHQSGSHRRKINTKGDCFFSTFLLRYHTYMSWSFHRENGLTVPFIPSSIFVHAYCVAREYHRFPPLGIVREKMKKILGIKVARNRNINVLPGRRYGTMRQQHA